MLRTPEQAQAALDLGLSLAVVGKGLVINPDWVGLAELGCGTQIRQELDLDERAALFIPDGLWPVACGVRWRRHRGGFQCAKHALWPAFDESDEI